MEEGYQLVAGPLDAERDGDRAQPSDRVEPQLDVLILELVDEDGDRVERRRVGVRLHGTRDARARLSGMRGRPAGGLPASTMLALADRLVRGVAAAAGLPRWG